MTRPGTRGGSPSRVLRAARDAGERAAADPGDSAGNLDARVPGESCGIPFPLCRGGDDPHEAVR